MHFKFVRGFPKKLKKIALQIFAKDKNSTDLFTSDKHNFMYFYQLCPFTKKKLKINATSK